MKSSKGGRRTAYMNKKPLAKLKGNGKERSMECRKRDRSLEKSTGMLSEHAGKQRGMLRSTWN